MKWHSLWLTALAVVASAGLAWADWNVGDPYKMHYPQLPDPFGWDVLFTQPKVLADDWQCTESGPVSAVHLWFSSKGDAQFNMFSVHLSIHADIPADPAGGIPYSRPGPKLWEMDFGPAQFSTRLWGTGEQGWYDPNTGYWQRPDHFNIWQLNIQNIMNPFYQQQGMIYWLDVSVMSDVPLGWKTSSQHFNDDAVWGDFPTPEWIELRDPTNPLQSLDLAFVIVPEPSVWMLVTLGVVGVLLTRRYRK